MGMVVTSMTKPVSRASQQMEGQEHTNSDYTRRQQARRVARHAQGGKDGRRIVQHGVDTGPLLEEHGDGGDDDAAEHGHGLEQRADGDKLQLGDVGDGGLGQVREVGLDGPLLEERLGLDLEELELDGLVLGRGAAQLGQHAARLVLAAVVDEPPRREGHEDHAEEEDQRRHQLQAQRHQPGRVALGVAGAADVVGSVVDPERDHDTELNRELLDADQHATDFGRGTFGVVYSISGCSLVLGNILLTHRNNHPAPVSSRSEMHECRLTRESPRPCR